MEDELNLQKKKLDLANKLISDYSNILSEKALELLFKAFNLAIKDFPAINELGYRSNAKSVLYPKLKDISKPFKICPIDKLKGIILAVEPYNNGEASGIPFQFDPSYRAKFLLPDTQHDVDCIDEAVGIDLRDPFFGMNWNSLLEQGILVMHLSLTSVEKENMKHVPLWASFTQEFIKCIQAIKEVPVLTIGAIFKTLDKDIKKTIKAPNAFYTIEDRLEFRKFKPFNKLNEALVQNGDSEIIF